jgi:hypothetical protein
MAASASLAALAGNEPEGRCARGPSVQSAGSCLTMAWSRWCSSAWMVERGIGEHRVVAPGAEQLVLPGGCLLVLVADPPHDQPGADRLSLLRSERRVGDLGDLGVGDPAAQLVIPDRAGVPDGGPGVLPMAAIAACTCGFIATVTEKNASAARTAPVNAAE